MYAVVGCGACSNLWIVDGAPKTTECPRCGTRRPFRKRKRFVETDDIDHARDVRASMLANRQGEGDAFAALDSVSTLESSVEDGVLDEDEYLEASGLDVSELEEAGESSSREPVRHGSQREIVEAALVQLETPTHERVTEYATERGLDAPTVDRILQKLVRNGTVSEHRGQYRLL